MEKKGTPASPAIALANKALPVPVVPPSNNLLVIVRQGCGIFQDL